MTMGQNKLENQIREKLNSREIQPSAQAWDRLDAMLSVSEEKKTRRSFGWLYIAASVLVLVTLGTFFFSQKSTEINQNTVVGTEVKIDTVVKTPNSKFQIPIKKENQVAVSNQPTTDNRQQTTFLTLRQQSQKTAGAPNKALADFIAPKSSGKQDYMGCFCVTTGFGLDEIANQYVKDLDDYNSIMIKALGDRLAEAFAEYLHLKVRKEIWGYASNENLNNQELIKEEFKGIRPAPGYPACPDHLEKPTIWKLLNVEQEIGVKLTESMAMWPASSVSGYYFANPESSYFGLGKIKQDQVIDYAKRRGISTEVATKWLSPNIAE